MHSWIRDGRPLGDDILDCHNLVMEYIWERENTSSMLQIPAIYVGAKQFDTIQECMIELSP